MSFLKPIHPSGLAYNHIVGVGGIGSGMFFSLADNQTIGRNESRMATLLPSKDFCKQHIIMLYMAVLLGAEINGRFQSFPIGKVGKDTIGEDLIQKMKKAGMDTAGVQVSKDFPTLFSICYQYPDFEGGNLTTENSASSQLTPQDVIQFFENFHLSGDKEVVLAAPEVPIDTRLKLLEYGRKRGSLAAASILSGETEEFRNKNGFKMVDLLSINMDEAKSIARIMEEPISAELVTEACISSIVPFNPEISILITDGSNGSYCYTHNHLEYTPALPVPVVSTAGAGDAFMSGTLIGLCCGLPLIKGTSDRSFSASPLQSAVELGTLLAALSVTSPDTIHLAAEASVLNSFALERGACFGSDFMEIFKMTDDKYT